MAINWQPHNGPQMDFCESAEDEVLYGGAAGGGKTDCLIAEATRFVKFPDYRAIIFRRTFPELQEILDRTRGVYPGMGGDYRASEHRWHFPRGATVAMGHMADNGSEYLYQGREYQCIEFDEAGQFLPKQLLYLFSRCRSTNPNIPKRIRYATNPGGPAHQFLKDRFQIGQYPEGGKTFFEEVNVTLPSGDKISEVISRRFVPAKLEDNPSLIKNDPGYVARLMQLPLIERMRLLEGIWDAFEGQAFPDLNKEVHGFDFDPPPEWERFGAFDWGYSKPWVYGIFAVDYEGRIYLYKMYYGCKEKETDMGVRMTDTEIARAVRDIEDGEPKIRWRVADPSIWSRRQAKDGMLGPSPADNMTQDGIVFVKADNNRVNGWQQIHHRLRVDEQDGMPWLFIHKGLSHVWRTLPLMRENTKDPEDLETKNVEDHIADMVRYAVMTRPMKPKVLKRSDIGSFQYERRKYIRAKAIAQRHGISIVNAYGRG
jgi:hypothetical protein